MNINEPLVAYRLSAGAFDRRSTFMHTRSFIYVRWINYKCGFSNFFDFLIPCAVQFIIVFGTVKSKEMDI